MAHARVTSFVVPLVIASFLATGMKVGASGMTNDVATVGPEPARLLDTVPLEGHPSAMVASSDGMTAYLVDKNADRLLIVDLPGRQLVSTVPVGQSPIAVAVAPDEEEVYTANAVDRSLSIIDLRAEPTVTSVPVGVWPSGLVLSEDGAFAYVRDAGMTSVSVVDMRAREEVRVVSRLAEPALLSATDAPEEPAAALVPSLPIKRMLVADTGRIAAATDRGGDVWLLDLDNGSTLARIPGLGPSLRAAAFSTDPATAHLAFTGTDDLVAVDVSTGQEIGELGLDRQLGQIEISLDGKRALVSDDSIDGVLVLDLETWSVDAVVPVGQDPDRIALSADGSIAVVEVADEDGLPVVDVAASEVTLRLDAPLPVGDFAVSPDGRFVYVVDDWAGAVRVYDLAVGWEVGSIPAGSGMGLASIAVSADGSTLYALDPLFGTLIAVEPAAGTEASVWVGDRPTDIALVPDSSLAVVADAGAGTVVLVDLESMQAVGTVLVGDRPASVTISPDGRMAYVVDEADHQVTTVDLVAAASATEQQSGSLDVGGMTEDLAISPDGQTAWVVRRGPGQLLSLDLSDGLQALPVRTGWEPGNIAMSPDGAFAHVLDVHDGSLYSVDLLARRSLRTPDLADPALLGDGLLPPPITVSPDGERGYMLHFGGQISVIDLVAGTEIAQLQPELDGLCIGCIRGFAPDHDGRAAWVLFDSNVSGDALRALDLGEG